jgi:hypothetical protein
MLFMLPDNFIQRVECKESNEGYLLHKINNKE